MLYGWPIITQVMLSQSRAAVRWLCAGWYISLSSSTEELIVPQAAHTYRNIRHNLQIANLSPTKTHRPTLKYDMSLITLLYGLIIFACDQVPVKSSAISSPALREESSGPLLLYNPSSHDLDPFEYGVKREPELRARDSESVVERGHTIRQEHPAGASYIRLGRSQEQLNSGYNNEASNSDRTPRGRSDNIIRFGRSGLKSPHHKIERSGRAGYVRFGRSGSSIYVRFGRSYVPNSPSAPSDAELALLCPNILVEDDARASEDLQLYLAKLMYLCNNNNNNNNNNGPNQVDGNIEDNETEN